MSLLNKCKKEILETGNTFPTQTWVISEYSAIQVKTLKRNIRCYTLIKSGIPFLVGT